MGNASLQGSLWSQGAANWAELQEHFAVPVHEACLNAVFATRGTRVLDAGCGAGTAAVLAHLRGASVSGIDAARGLIDIALARLPSCDFREADLEALPFDDESFDAVVAINSIFYAADPRAAAMELARVVRREGRVAIANWGPPDQSDWMNVGASIAALMPPSPSPAANGPATFSAPGALEDLLQGVGVRPILREVVSAPFTFRSLQDMWLSFESTGNAVNAIRLLGEQRVRDAISGVHRRFARTDGSARFENRFIVVAGEKL